MQYTELPAPPPFNRLVHCFWFLRADTADDEPQTIVPDGRAEIVLHLREPFAEVREDGTVQPQASALVGGQLMSPFRLAMRGASDVVGIRFRTEGARALFRFPLHEITGAVRPLREWHPPLAAALLDAASLGTDAPARVASLTARLGRFVREEPSRRIAAAVERLEPPASHSIRSLAAQLGTSVRTLERQMTEDVGLTPKELHRVLRFRRAFQLLDRAPARSWARVATCAGYYDQAHLIREFRRFAGASPSEFFRADPELARAFGAPVGT
jgi:AraC-like DNA-binding protein